MAEVAGPVGQLTDKIASGYGFAAIIVACRLNPFGIFLASVVMALFYIGGEQAQQYLSLPSAIAKVFQGCCSFSCWPPICSSITGCVLAARRVTDGTNLFSAILFATVVAGTPLIIVALYQLVTERAGVLNLGAEGMMAIGAIVAFAVTHHSGNHWAAGGGRHGRGGK